MSLLFRLALTGILFAFGSQAMASERVLPSAASTSYIADLMKSAKDTGTVKVIVGLRVPFAAEGRLKSSAAQVQRADIARATTSFQSRFAAAIKRKPKSFRSYESIPFAAIEVTPGELEQLSRDPAVVSITANRLHQPNLVESIPLVRADVAQKAGFSGSGQTVAIIDTGVDKNHPFLKGRVVAEACFSSGGWCPGGATTSTAPGSGMPCPEDCAHGTHVAGIVAGSDSTSTGVAPQASLMSVQVFGPGGEAETADIIAGLDHVYSRRNDFKIAAVNMSLGSSSVLPDGCGEYGSPGEEAVMANLRSAGIAPVVASGNEGKVYGLSNPACLPSAIAVGAVSTKDWGDCVDDPNLGSTARDKVTCYSNTSSKLALLAPGTLIRSSVPGGGFALHQGTSMAAPHVAGAWAVLKQKKPDASVDEILDALKAGGVMVSDYRTGQETPRIDVKGALDFLDTNALKLSFNKVGTGQGAVAFSPADKLQRCAGNCVVTYGSGTEVTLSATPAASSIFEGWAGACTGKASSCTVTMSEARSVTATFSRPWSDLNLKMAGSGKGAVLFVNLPQDWASVCSEDCGKKFDKGSRVLVYPYPETGSLFGGWSGACSGRNFCAIDIAGASELTATFDSETGGEQTLTYQSTGPGEGFVSFRPIGSEPDCDEGCTSRYSAGTKVDIEAEASLNSTFQGWTGACTTSGAVCSVSMNKAQTITARFIENNVLTFTRAGSGTGGVLFSPQGSNAYCYRNCEVFFPPSKTVTLTPNPTRGSTFQGWSGACKGKGKCSVQMSRARAVTATFAAPPPKLALSYQKIGGGKGTVSFSPAEANATCTASCVNTYTAGARVTLRVRAIETGSVFAGWTGACRGKGSCTVRLRAAATVGATFNLLPVHELSYVKAGTGQGKVSFSPASATPGDCTASCSKSYINRTKVTLRATADAGSRFTGWTGACKGRKTCVVTMSQARSVTATFALISPAVTALTP